MNTRTAIVLATFVFAGGIFLLSNGGSLEKNIPVVEPSKQISAKQNWESKTDDQSAIAITITPVDILSSSSEWKFDVAMNTHSVELESPMLSTILIDDEGNEHKPIAWDGPTEGHHMNGILVFDKITLLPKFITLKIKNTDEVVKNFTWQFE